MRVNALADLKVPFLAQTLRPEFFSGPVGANNSAPELFCQAQARKIVMATATQRAKAELTAPSSKLMLVERVFYFTNPKSLRKSPALPC